MVAAFLIISLFVAVVPAWGGGSQLPQFCLSCHASHYAERGKCSDCHRGNPGSERKNIAHAGLRAGKYARFTLNDAALTREAEQLLEQCACRRCHITSGRGNLAAVNLDAAAVRRTAGELALSIQRPVANMPDFGLGEEQITVLVNAIGAGSQGRKIHEAAPVRVHFNTAGKKKPDIFSVKCGGCHRMLNLRLGAVGTGATAPNLSGLFSEYYPKTFKMESAWNARNHSIWLNNPRKVRPWAKMPPVTLTDSETKELLSVFLVTSETDK